MVNVQVDGVGMLMRKKFRESIAGSVAGTRFRIPGKKGPSLTEKLLMVIDDLPWAPKSIEVSESLWPRLMMLMVGRDWQGISANGPDEFYLWDIPMKRSESTSLPEDVMKIVGRRSSTMVYVIYETTKEGVSTDGKD